MKATNAAPVISPVMQELVAYIARARTKALPSWVVGKTKHHLLDTLAAMVSGSRLPPGRQGLTFDVWTLERVHDMRQLRPLLRK